MKIKEGESRTITCMGTSENNKKCTQAVDEDTVSQ